MAFPRHQRIKDSKRITKILRESRPLNEGGISIRTLKGSSDGNFTVSVLVPKNASESAVQRNRLRRRVAEAMRRILGREPHGARGSILITARHAPLLTHDLTTLLVLLMKKSGILER